VGATHTHEGDTVVPSWWVRRVNAGGAQDRSPQSHDWGRRTVPGLPKGEAMNDLIFVAATIIFFLIAVVYMSGCERLKGGRSDA